MALGCLQIPLSNTEEAGWGAVTSTPFVAVVARAVKVVEGILVSPTALTADDKVFVSSASFDCVA